MAEAAAVDVDSPVARAQFMIELFREELYVTGETAEVLGELWGKAPATIVKDAGRARLALDVSEDKRGAVERFWLALFDGLERGEALARKADALLAAYVPAPGPAGGGGDSGGGEGDGAPHGRLEPEELANVARAISAMHELYDKAVERLGKASGAITTGPAVAVQVNLVDPQTPGDRRLAAALAARDEALFAALEGALSLVPDRALRGRVLAAVAAALGSEAEEGRPGDGAMVLSQGGGGGGPRSGGKAGGR